MIRAWRIVSSLRAQSAFDGEGARRFGGRWNSPGTPAVYLAGSRALAALEMLVHLNERAARQTFVRFEVRIPGTALETDDAPPPLAALNSPVVSAVTQARGDRWLNAGKRPALAIASAVIPEEPNYLLNPRHPKFKDIEIGEAETFAFDPRLLES